MHSNFLDLVQGKYGGLAVSSDDDLRMDVVFDERLHLLEKLCCQHGDASGAITNLEMGRGVKGEMEGERRNVGGERRHVVN